MRITYEHELEELNKCLRDMAMMVEKAIEQTFVAFEDQNYTMAEDVIKGDRNVNDMERAIESRCLSLILRQQPVAKDLRQISTALKVVTDLERIGGKWQKDVGLSLARQFLAAIKYKRKSLCCRWDTAGCCQLQSGQHRWRKAHYGIEGSRKASVPFG